MSTPEQIPLFETQPGPQPRSPEEIAEFTAAIAASARPAVETETATERYFAEMGGGAGSGTATQEPPRLRRPDKRPLSPRAGMDREEARAEDQVTNTELYRLSGAVDPSPEAVAERQRILDSPSHKLAEKVVAEVVDQELRKKSAGDNTLVRAMARARAEKRARHHGLE